MTEINIQYPNWYLILCPFIGLVYATLLYYKNEGLGEQASWISFLLSGLRATAVALIILMLLDPFIRSVIQDQKNPIVVILEDQSSSISLSMDKDSLSIHKERMDGLNEQLSALYDVQYHAFGTEVGEVVLDSSLTQSSNIDRALMYVRDNYADQNLGAVILSSDGIFNEGKNPIYANYGINAPLHTIALGDTTARKDAWIKNVFHNQIVYLGDQLAVQIDAQATNCSGEKTSLTLSKVESGKERILKKEKINIASQDYFKTITYEINADKPGINHYRVSLGSIRGESPLDNNVKDFYIEVLDARQKILIIANAPHPDISAIRTLLSINKNYEIDLQYVYQNQKVVQNYDFVILHNLPSSTHAIDQVLGVIQKEKIPHLYIVGQQTDLQMFNRQQDVVQVNTNQKLSNNVQASINASFTQFNLSNTFKQDIGTFPPLYSIFGEFVLGPKTYVALSQRISDIETDYPLLAFSELNGQRVGVLTAEGLWKWKLFEYAQNQSNELTQELLLQSVQYLSIKEDKRRFRVRSNKNLYKENESVFLEAQLFNASYEAVNDTEVTIKVTNENNESFDYTMSQYKDYYTLAIKGLNAGSYTFSANTSRDGQQMYDKGSFTIQMINLESYDLAAKHYILSQLSSNSEAQMIYSSDIKLLEQQLTIDNKLKPVLYDSTQTYSVLNFFWMLALIIVLLLLEWFIRRYIGSY